MRQIVADVGEAPEQKVSLLLRRMWRSPEEHDARTDVVAQGEQFTEVGVGAHEDAIPVPGRLHHVGVDGTEEAEVAHMYGIVASFGEQPGDADRHRLVDEESQPAEASGSSRSSTAAAA
ncbi:MAG TPA: hypothetical protein VHF47_08665 [Acidimicrobiales bacterium]|nr:hypothetical protein [Acidimicrobiales bacterium]